MRKSKSGSDESQCDVADCKELSKRSISFKKVESALPNLKFKKTTKKVHLCKLHYKEFKKATKTERALNKLTWD